MVSTRILLTSLISCLLLAAPAQAALTVLVVEGGCTLPDAIAAANADAPVGGCAAPELGSGGPFEVVLPEGSGPYVLSAPVGAGTDGDLGLPAIASVLTLAGNGNAIEREAGAADFRLIEVTRSGDAVLEDVTLHNGAAPRGGAVYNAGVLALRDVVVSGSTATEGDGGGVLSVQATLDIERSTLRGNVAAGMGGGIFNFVDSVLTMRDSTVSGNEAARGGAMENLQGRATLVNSTLSGNLADTGGAVANSGGGVLSLASVTVAANDAPGGGDGVLNVAGTISFAHVLMSDRCLFLRSPGSIDAGYNLERRNNSCGLSEPTSVFGVDPLIGPLVDNGGPTDTHIVMAGSPAIDAGGACGASDQRGVERSDGACDVGAVEVVDCDGGGADDLAEIAADPGLDLDGNGVLDLCENEAPVADAGPDQIVECSSPDGTPVTFDGSGSFDPDGDAIALYWRTSVGRARGAAATFDLPVGMQTATLFVGDERGAMAFDSAVAIVEDRVPPQAGAQLISFSGSGNTFLVRVTCVDVCDGSPSVSGTANGVAVTDGQVFNAGAASEVVLETTCVDAAGNPSSAMDTAQVVVQASGGLERDDDDDDDDDDDGDDD